MRLSKKQKGLLREIAAVPPFNGGPGCLYLPHWTRYESFSREREPVLFARNLATRGFITIENDFFLRITESGLAAIS